MNTAMLVWGGSAVRVEEAFADPWEREKSDHALQTNVQGFQKRIPANTRLQLHWRDSNETARHVWARAIEVGEFEMIVEAEKQVRIGMVAVVNTAESGFVGRVSIQRCEPKGLNYLVGLCTLNSQAREL